MKYKVLNKNIAVKLDDKFSLTDTLLCGQCFRWYELSDERFAGVVSGKYVEVSYDGDFLIFYNVSENFFKGCLAEYFDLYTSYSDIQKDLLGRHPFLDQAIKNAPGIRILKQDSFETMISFIISQNNNIKRISSIVKRLCENFGTRSDDGSYAFPTIEQLASLQKKDFDILKCGFRVPYIMDAVRKVYMGKIDLCEMQKLPLDDARSILMTVRGIGPKVAECVLLYGMHRLEAFPMDVWMKKAMSEFFPDLSPKDFGPYAGVAQQYIFHYVRNRGKDICDA